MIPSVYIEGVTQLAFDDITSQSPNFPYIQGLSFSIYEVIKLHQEVIKSEYTISHVQKAKQQGDSFSID